MREVRLAQSPSLLRPRTFPGTRWPGLTLPVAGQVWAAYLELDRTQWLDPFEIEQGQLRQVRALLAHCVQHVPYYRELLATHGIAPDGIQSMEDFRRIPVLDRRTYQERFALMQARNLPEGTRRVGRLHTSGTSGVPIEVLQTNVAQLWWLAFRLRDLQWCGIDPLGSIAAIRVTGHSGPALDVARHGMSLPHWGALDDVVETGAFHVMDVFEDPHRQLDWLVGVAPNYLLSYPSHLEFLAALMQEQGLRISTLRMVQTIAETLSGSTRARIEAAFGVPVKDTYSCNEAGHLASPCPEGHGAHVHAENVILEVVDAEGRPCPPGSTGRVLLTSLQNFLTPFIRYDVMDEAEVGPERCACGRGLPSLAQVWGKGRPMLRLPDGRVKTSVVLSVGLRQVGGFRQFQVVQRAPDHLIVRLVPDPTWTPHHSDRVVALVHEEFGAPVRVEVTVLDRLAPTRGGKILDFVTETEPEPTGS
jgi:phenylacetate-CoA ligase